MILTPHTSCSVAANVKDGNAPLHVLMHGLQGTKELFLKFADEPYFSGRALLVPDFPGFGDSPPALSVPGTVEAYATFVEELVTSRGYREAIVVGHSLGGMVGTRLLQSTSLSVRALVSLEGNLTLEDCGASREIAMLTQGEFVRQFYPNMLRLLESSCERSAPFRLEALRRVDPGTLYRASCSIVEHSRSGELLRIFTESKVPRLLLIGERSSFLSLRVCKNANTAIVPDAGHFMIHDNYGFVLNQIVRFLSDTRRE